LILSVMRVLFAWLFFWNYLSAFREFKKSKTLLLTHFTSNNTGVSLKFSCQISSLLMSFASWSVWWVI
jgi:hypothetical protein